MNSTMENYLETKTYLEIFKDSFAKISILFLVLVFSFSSIQAMQTKNTKPKKKKVTKQLKYKKTVKKSNPHLYCEVNNCPYDRGRRKF